jgi:hypothetical protein
VGNSENRLTLTGRDKACGPRDFAIAGRATGGAATPHPLQSMVQESRFALGNFPLEIKDFSKISYKTHAKKTTFCQAEFPVRQLCF